MVEKYMYHALQDDKYIGIVTILDYESRLDDCLSEISFSGQEGKKLIVDMALKTGINCYRFLVFDIQNEGNIQAKSGDYLQNISEIERKANIFLSERMDIVNNSMLPRSKINALKAYSQT